MFSAKRCRSRALLLLCAQEGLPEARASACWLHTTEAGALQLGQLEGALKLLLEVVQLSPKSTECVLISFSFLFHLRELV